MIGEVQDGIEARSFLQVELGAIHGGNRGSKERLTLLGFPQVLKAFGEGLALLWRDADPLGDSAHNGQTLHLVVWFGLVWFGE